MNTDTAMDWIRGFLMELKIPVKGNCRLLPGGKMTAVMILASVICALGLGIMAAENGSLPQIICFTFLVLFWIFLGGAYISGKKAEKKQEKPLPINEAYLEIVKCHDYSKLPEFPYMPDAYRNGVIQKGRNVCGCCNHETEYIADGIYWHGDIVPVCPWCLASGAAAVKYINCEFNPDYHPPMTSEAVEEIIYRTPPIPGWQDIQWESCCNDAMLYLEAIGTKKALEKYRGNTAFENEIHDFEPFPEFDQLQAELPDKGESSLLVHVFKCQHCGRYKLNFDAD